MTTPTILEEQQSYLLPSSNESYEEAFNQEPFFQWVKEEGSLSPALLKATLTNTLYVTGTVPDLILNHSQSEEFKSVLSEMLECPTNEGMEPTSFKTLKELGYEGEADGVSPADNIIQRVENKKLNDRGLYYDSKKRLQLNSNIFAKYILERLRLVNHGGNGLFAYNKKGIFSGIEEGLLKKICRDILHEAKDNIWKRHWEGEYFEALVREMDYVHEMNPSKEFINLKNGMLNRSTMEFVPHDPKYYSTLQVDIDYNKNATCPEFMAFLRSIFNNDQERIDLIQEIMGYCFIQEVKIQKAFIFLGSGSNGKSLLASIIRRLVGEENTSSVSLNELGGRFGMQSLPGKLVNISSENEFDKKFNTQNFKLLTGGDAVNVEQKYKDSFNIILVAKLLVLLNKMFDADDISEGYYRRLQIITFDNKYEELTAGEEPVEGVEYMDKTLEEKLVKELDGILIFALKGLNRLIQNDFNLTQSAACDKALEEYKVRQNPVIEFYHTHIMPVEGARVRRADFKNAFSEWASSNGFEEAASMGATKFWDMMRRILAEKRVEFSEKKIQGTIYLVGLELNDFNNDCSDYIGPC